MESMRHSFAAYRGVGYPRGPKNSCDHGQIYTYTPGLRVLTLYSQIESYNTQRAKTPLQITSTQCPHSQTDRTGTSETHKIALYSPGEEVGTLVSGTVDIYSKVNKYEVTSRKQKRAEKGK